jgi:hypothetical protein
MRRGDPAADAAILCSQAQRINEKLGSAGRSLSEEISGEIDLPTF